MKKNSLLLLLILSVNILFAQNNSYPPTGDVEINTGKLLVETSVWRESLLTFMDTHYTPFQVYKFQLESDGLKIRQDNNVNYLFQSGGNFILNRGYLGIGTETPINRLEVFGSTFNRISATVNSDVQNGFQLKRTGANATDWEIYTPAGSSNLRFYNANYGDILTMSNDGKLGVNTDQPLSKFHINTSNWQPSLFALSDSHYGSSMIYHFQIESDGLKIKRDNSSNYLFSTTGDFIVYNGSVQSKEVKVSINPGTGPDYVFDSTYQLPSLTEIESYIKANKHLPEVPSAKEMEANGINLSEMNMLLLKKVEELTLHLIEATKKIEKQQMQIDTLNTIVYEKK